MEIELSLGPLAIRGTFILSEIDGIFGRSEMTRSKANSLKLNELCYS
jgi:hypothetical protein